MKVSIQKVTDVIIGRLTAWSICLTNDKGYGLIELTILESPNDYVTELKF